jgi:replicative superfamily II helicase
MNHNLISGRIEIGALAAARRNECRELALMNNPVEDGMKEQMKELQKLKGVGEVLSRRLVEASYDTRVDNYELPALSGKG